MAASKVEAVSGYRAYDPVGNRLSKQQNSSVVGGTFNNLNQLTSLTGGSGQLQVSGTVSKTSKVTVQSGPSLYPATSLWGTNFSANILAVLGTNTFSVIAQDANTNIVTNTYQIAVNALEGSRNFTYDANGNCLSDGQRTYTWDAANRLASVTVGSNTYSFGYDYAGRRISEYIAVGTAWIDCAIAQPRAKAVGRDERERASQKLNGTLIKKTLWDAADNSPIPLQERNATNGVSKRFFAQGEVQNGTNYYYLRDHLGSIREMVNGSGTIVSEATYDPYGVASVSGSVTPTFQYAGYYTHQGTGLNLTWYRAYDPVIGRWLSRDPIGEKGGIDLYGYIKNQPVKLTDRLGLCPIAIPIIIGGEALLNGAVGTGAGVMVCSLAKECFKKKCPPCSPYPAGTVGYIGPHNEHSHYPYGPGHVNLFQVNQNPDTCKCFWNKSDAAEKIDPRWVDLNNGFPPLTP